eukprot:CAMPEP_0169239424 /NCGR_PEP_ID=MMETSP1016-20121227/30904_1 /TAXON_ID=342587 /ORGANISM="Karlodinium micrum, Strain CCMP2283" /LENGTH=133 /DNA_ID=CAMNT_0009319357 /DNA_START=140 /DNA_END=537 /DNA_ORIENTATION=+
MAPQSNAKCQIVVVEDSAPIGALVTITPISRVAANASQAEGGGAGGAKALKKISCSRSGGLREGWCLVVTEAREAELGIEWSFPDRWLREEGPVRRNGSIAHIEDASPALTVSPVPVLPAAFARGDKKARRGW